MAQLNPRIILSGQQADIPGSFQRGLEFKQQRQFAAQDLRAGDLKNQNNITAANREREFLGARRGLALIQRAETPELWDTIAAKVAPDLVGQFNRREELAATFQTLIEALDPQTPDKPIFFKGQRGAVNQILPDGNGGFTFNEIVPPGGATAGKPSALHQRAVEGGLTPGTPEFEQFMLTGGRSQFRVINDPVTKRLVVFDMQKLEIVGEAPEGAVAEQPPPLPVEDTLFGQADRSTGVLSSIGSASSGTFAQLPGELGRFFFFEDIVKARKALSISTQALLQAFVINKKFPVKEVERVKNEIGAISGVATSPREMRTNLRELDRFLRRKIASQDQYANDRRTPADEAAAAATNVRAMQEYLVFMGVPQDGAAPEVIDLQNEQPFGAEAEEAVPQSAISDGVTPTQWRLMTPQERALWLN